MRIKQRVNLAIQIAEGGKAPSEIRLFAPGWNDTTKGMFLCDEQSIAQITQAFADYGNRLTWYFGHPEFDGRPAQEEKSAGSFLLEARQGDTGLEPWAIDIQWADGVAGAIERKEWLYHSPGFWYETENRRIIEIINCALTNEPATKNARPLLMAASRLEALGMSHEQLRGKLQMLVDQVLPETREGVGTYNYVRDVFDDSVVIERAGKLIQFKYATDPAGNPVLVSGPVEVITAYQPIPQVNAESLGAVPYKAGPIDDTAGWSAKAAEKSVRDWAKKSDGSTDWSKYRRAFAWYDDADQESVGAYKLIHHEFQQGELTISRAGCMAAAAACMGSRGGVDIPEADLEKVKSHLGQHYKAMDMVAPWDRKEQQSSSHVAGTVGRDPKEISIMDKAFLSTLGLPETATDTEALAKLTKVSANIEELCKLTGKANQSEALGVVSGWKANAELVPSLQQKIAEQEAAGALRENEKRQSAVIAILDAAPTKVLPAMRPGLLSARKYDCDDDVKWLEGHVASLPHHPAMSGAGAGNAKTDAQVSTNPLSTTKKWEELKPAQRAELYRENKQQYDALKAEHQARIA